MCTIVLEKTPSFNDLTQSLECKTEWGIINDKYSCLDYGFNAYTNAINLQREYYQEFACEFDLYYYPFDTQVRRAELLYSCCILPELSLSCCILPELLFYCYRVSAILLYIINDIVIMMYSSRVIILMLYITSVIDLMLQLWFFSCILPGLVLSPCILSVMLLSCCILPWLLLSYIITTIIVIMMDVARCATWSLLSRDLLRSLLLCREME